MIVATTCENVTMKTCTKCKRSLLRSAFYASLRNKDGLQCACKECHRGYRRAKQIVCGCGRVMDERATLCRRCSNTGANSPKWRGGRYRHASGYIKVHRPTHPRARHYPGGGGGHVLEHVLVLEGVLGRHLVPGETVHHLNGVRDDNRPENLELWTKPQKPNIRASDAVAWAKEVLRRYEPEALR